MTTFGSASGTAPPYDVTGYPFFTLFKLGIGISRESFWVVTCCRNLCPINSHFFVVLPKNGTYNLINSALHHLSPQRTTSVILLYSPIN